MRCTGLMMSLALLVAAGGAHAQTQDPPAPPPEEVYQPEGDEWMIRPGGIQGVALGMSEAQALEVVGERWGVTDGPGPCRTIIAYTDAEGDYGPVSFTVKDGRVVGYRVDSINLAMEARATYRTDQGIHLGSTEQEVRRAYGDKLQAGSAKSPPGAPPVRSIRGGCPGRSDRSPALPSPG